MRVFVSRFNTGLRPGDGKLINWEIGERVQVISGQDEGRIFVVDSAGMSHNAVPAGQYVREGWFEDDPTKQRVAKAESVLWFAPVPDSIAHIARLFGQAS